MKLNFKFHRKDLRESLSEIFRTIKEIITGKKDLRYVDESVRDYYKFSTPTEKRTAHFTRNEKISFAILAITIINVLILVYQYPYSLARLQPTILCTSPLYVLPLVVLPYVGWVLGTNERFWAFHQRKRLYFYICTINVLLIALQPIYSIARDVVVPLVLKLKPNGLLTMKMIVHVGHVGTFLLFSIIATFILVQFEPLVTSPSLKVRIERFKLVHFFDGRKDKEYQYDFRSVYSLETGRNILVKERDRMLHFLLSGVSGTGKTSGVFGPTIFLDLLTKMKNKEKREEYFLKLIHEGKATLQGPLAKFDERAIIPRGDTEAAIEKNRKEIEKIRTRFKDCNITLVAPNNSVVDDIIRLCNATHQSVNVLDPVYSYSEYGNVIEKGINPFYIEYGLTEEDRKQRITDASQSFADVLIALNKLEGETDVYFSDITYAVTCNIASIVMLARNLQHEQALIDDIHDCIANFQNLQEYVDLIEKHFDIQVQVPNAATSQRNPGAPLEPNAKANAGISTKDAKKAKKNPYYHQLLFVKQELLGSGAEKMFDQARGLRNLIQKILTNPQIHKMLSADEERMLNFDEILATGQVTLVNTALELSSSISTTFGLFFLLNYRSAMLRRPKGTRYMPSFLWVDEATQYLHKLFEEMVTLFRQYGGAVVIALQSLSQTEKSNATRYLKQVFLGAGTQIVFGRLSKEEMELYQSLGGISREMVEQKQDTSSSIFASNPTQQSGVRSSQQVVNNFEGSDLRILDFLELTIFTVDNGRTLPGQHGRVFFLSPDNFDEKPRREIDWEKAVPEAFKEDDVFIRIEDIDSSIGNEKTSIPNATPILTQRNVSPERLESQQGKRTYLSFFTTTQDKQLDVEAEDNEISIEELFEDDDNE